MNPCFVWWLLQGMEVNDDLFASVKAGMRDERFRKAYTKAWAHHAERIIWRRSDRDNIALQREREGWDGKWTPDLSMEEYGLRQIDRATRKPSK